MNRMLLQKVGGGQFDPDYQAVLDYYQANNFDMPIAEVKEIQNQMVIDLKAENIRSLAVNDNYIALGYAAGGEVKIINWTFTELTNLTRQTDLEGMTLDANNSLWVSRNNQFHSGTPDGDRVWKYNIN